MRTVADAMITPAVTTPPSATIQDASTRMLDAGAHAAVVVDDGRVCGLATAVDVSGALADGYDPTDTPIGVIAEPDPPAARPDEPVAEVHQRMRAQGRSLLPVLAPDGRPVGILEDPEGATTA